MAISGTTHLTTLRGLSVSTDKTTLAGSTGGTGLEVTAASTFTGAVTANGGITASNLAVPEATASVPNPITMGGMNLFPTTFIDVGDGSTGPTTVFSVPYAGRYFVLGVYLYDNSNELICDSSLITRWEFNRSSQSLTIHHPSSLTAYSIYMLVQYIPGSINAQW